MNHSFKWKYLLKDVSGAGCYSAATISRSSWIIRPPALFLSLFSLALKLQTRSWLFHYSSINHFWMSLCWLPPLPPLVDCSISWLLFMITGATRGSGNAHSFRNTWFHSLWGVYDFTHSLYLHYRICQSKDYVYELMTLVCLPGLVWLFTLLCLPALVGLLCLGLILL